MLAATKNSRYEKLQEFFVSRYEKLQEFFVAASIEMNRRPDNGLTCVMTNRSVMRENRTMAATHSPSFVHSTSLFFSQKKSPSSCIAQSKTTPVTARPLKPL